MKAGLELFSESGFSKTGIRQIANRANISLGLVNHYFGSKKNLGAQTLNLFWAYLDQQTGEYVNNDPLLYDVLLTRSLNTYLLNGCFRQFYLDSLQEDVFFDSLSSDRNQTGEALRACYPFPSEPDMYLLYNRYVPYNIEKTLILKKEVGMFKNIPYDDIPYLICKSALEHFVPEAELIEADQKARKKSPEILRDLPPFPPDSVIADFVEKKLTAPPKV